MTSLRKFKAMAGLDPSIRTWKQAAGAYREAKAPTGWHPQVHQGYAQKDGLSPEDFNFTQWPVSDVALHLDVISRHVAAGYRCRMPKGTPQASQYKDGKPLPDPVGIALSWVQFQLIEVATGEGLHETNAGHIDGVVQGFLSGKARLWDKLQPGGAVDVYLTAVPSFYYLSADGGAHLEYALPSNGYFTGDLAKSPNYRLSMDHDGGLSVEQE